MSRNRAITEDQKYMWWRTHMNDLGWAGDTGFDGNRTNFEEVEQAVDIDLYNFELAGLDIEEGIKTQIADRELLSKIYNNYMLKEHGIIARDVPFSEMAETLFQAGVVEMTTMVASGGVSEIALGIGLSADLINLPENNTALYDQYYTTTDVMLSYVGFENYKDYVTQETNTSQDVWAAINEQFIEDMMLAERSNILVDTVTLLTGKRAEIRKLTLEQINAVVEFYNELPIEYQVVVMSLIDPNIPIMNAEVNIDSIQDDEEGTDHWPEVVEQAKADYLTDYGNAYFAGLARDHDSGSVYFGDEGKVILPPLWNRYFPVDQSDSQAAFDYQNRVYFNQSQYTQKHGSLPDTGDAFTQGKCCRYTKC